MKLKLHLFSVLLLLFVSSCQKQTEKFTRSQCFDEGWKFYLGKLPETAGMTVDDSQWRTLDLPHDWSIELPFSREKGNIATAQTVGGVGWYSKKFTLQPSQENKIIQLYFEGSYMETEVWLNGQKAGYHPYGYTSFFCDITPFCHPAGKENTLVVKVSNLGKNSRWYAGSGIYRHVWLITADLLHLDNWGVFVTTPSVAEDKATVHVSADILNETAEEQDLDAVIQIKDRTGKIAGEKTVHVTGLKAKEQSTLNEDIEITNPDLWSPDSPVLYTAVVSIQTGNRVRDEMTVPFGIRSIAFSPKEGFLLNGKSLKLKGGCVHHDNGLLGAASIDRAEERKVELLKTNGFNAVRCAHNPPAEKFLEACDRLGILVIDEAFDQWQKQKNPEDYHRFFDEWHEKDVTSMVKRDRNHPSIIMWSIGNEIPERADSSGVAIAKELKSIIRKYDVTRPVTAAICSFWDNPGLQWSDAERAFANLDVCGYNYRWDVYESDLKQFPDRVLFGGESTAMERAANWDLVEKYPNIIGDFVWTALDYLGESGIGHAVEVKTGEKEPPLFIDWPWFNAWCGDIDICGNKKPQSLLRDVLWNESKITMAVHKPLPEGYYENISFWGWSQEYPEWNWKGYENKPLEVRVFTRYPAVRLYLNNQLLEEKPVSTVEGSKTKYIASFTVNYLPGELKAVGVASGEEKESVTLRTAGAPAKIRLTPDRARIGNSRNDLSYVQIELLDENGLVVPDADCPVRLSVAGQGEIAAAGNASPTDMESFRSPTPKTFHGQALAIVRPLGKAGTISLKAVADGLPEAVVDIEALP
ncbi:MAG: DUF4982 domain-containing protein [Tannerella sp.]|jgi:hypothetical protein|nr:DUF4982 domain-containing protein [Tannerella sp.]